MKSPAPAAPAQVVVSKGRTRQVAEPKFARRAPQAEKKGREWPNKMAGNGWKWEMDGNGKTAKKI